MSDKFFHGYWRLKKENADLQQQLEECAEYEGDLLKHIENLEVQILYCERALKAANVMMGVSG